MGGLSLSCLGLTRYMAQCFQRMNQMSRRSRSLKSRPGLPEPAVRILLRAFWRETYCRNFGGIRGGKVINTSPQECWHHKVWVLRKLTSLKVSKAARERPTEIYTHTPITPLQTALAFPKYPGNCSSLKMIILRRSIFKVTIPSVP